MIEGSCLCKGVRFEVDGEVEEAHHCHCSMCRRAHGAAFATYARVATAKVRIASGEDAIVHYRSSPSVRRAFCRTCGGNLFFLHDAAPMFTFVAAGALDIDVRADAHTFVATKAPFFEITDAIQQYEGQRPEYQTG